jgi:hypothetical protein
VEDSDAWASLRPIVIGDLDPNLLDDLKLDNVLANDLEPPGFGHPTRREAARSFLAARRSEAVRIEVRRLASGLARSITSLSNDTIHYASALRGLQSTTSDKDLGPIPLALCQAATSLFGRESASPTALMSGIQQVRKSPEPRIGFVLATGLFNTLIDAKAEDDLSRRDALLDELRALASTYPDDPPVREQLVNGLFNTLNEGNFDVLR